VAASVVPATTSLETAEDGIRIVWLAITTCVVSIAMAEAVERPGCVSLLPAMLNILMLVETEAPLVSAARAMLEELDVSIETADSPPWFKTLLPSLMTATLSLLLLIVLLPLLTTVLSILLRGVSLDTFELPFK